MHSIRRQHQFVGKDHPPEIGLRTRPNRRQAPVPTGAFKRGRKSPTLEKEINMRLKRKTISCILILSAAALLGIYADAQEKGSTEITVPWIFSSRSYEISSLPNFSWLNDGTALIMDVRKPAAERTFERLNPISGKRTPILDITKAAAALKRIAGKTFSSTKLFRPAGFDRSGRQAVYSYRGDLFLLETASSRAVRITNTPEAENAVQFSPDGSRLAFVRKNDLYIYDIATGQETAITHDGSDTLLNGTLSWVYWEEIFGRRDIGYWWSEDSRSLAFLQTDESPVGVMEFQDYRPEYPRIIKQRYPKVGTANPVVRVGIADVESGNIIWADLSRHATEYICRVKWLPDGSRVSVQTLNRNQTEIDLYFVDRKTGSPTPILKETNPGWVNINDDLYFLKNGKHFLWASERDGFMHLYRYEMNGRLVNQITRGNWALRSAGAGPYWLRKSVTAIDEEDGWIYFTAIKESSVERHLYRIRLDGSGLERLTHEPGTHGISFSGDARYYFDIHSSASLPPSLNLYTRDGEKLQSLAPSRIDLRDAYAIQTPELFTIPAADGFPLPAQIIKPADFDPERRYPLILYVYGGPSAPQVADAWQAPYFEQILLRRGYLVARVDNRSASAISKKLENTILKQSMSDNELNDLVSAVHWFKSQTYIDPDRVGIWGWSGGGTFTLLAMTRSREFKAGISVAPVTRWQYYDTVWGEAAMKLPQDNPAGYAKTDLTRHAKNLHGRLMIVHGTYDDNVHIQNVWHFVDELIKANKMFDLMIYPMRKHGINDRPARIHLYTRMLDFWSQYL